MDVYMLCRALRTQKKQLKVSIYELNTQTSAFGLRFNQAQVWPFNKYFFNNSF
jgi:hypothetical protein